MLPHKKCEEFHNLSCRQEEPVKVGAGSLELQVGREPSGEVGEVRMSTRYQLMPGSVRHTHIHKHLHQGQGCRHRQAATSESKSPKAGLLERARATQTF